MKPLAPQPRPEALPAPVRRLMAKHGLTEPCARVFAVLAYGEVRNG